MTCGQKAAATATAAPRTAVAKARVAAPKAATGWTAKARAQPRATTHVAAIQPKKAYAARQTAPALRHYLYGLDGRLLLSTPAGGAATAAAARRPWVNPRAQWRRS